MDFKDVIIASAIGIIGVLAFIAVSVDINNSYGVDIGDGNGELSTLQSEMEGLQGNISSFGEEGRGVVNEESGKGLVGNTIDLGKKALKIITLIPKLIFQVIPSTIQAVANILGIPQYIVTIIGSIFVAVALFSLVYLLLLGARRLT